MARLRRVHRLRATQKRRFRPRTTDSRHLCPIAPNHPAARQKVPARPREAWQTDIAYVAMREGWLYLAGVLDACSRQIVGWAADDTMPTSLAARTFERAVQAQRPAPGLLHHSDRGSQYASDACRELRRSHGAVASMSRAGNGDDHAKMESFWATLKSEPIPNRVFASHAEAKSAIFWCIEAFYNRTRRHGALGFSSPVGCENSLSENTNLPALRRVHAFVERSKGRFPPCRDARSRLDARTNHLALVGRRRQTKRVVAIERWERRGGIARQ